MRLWSISDLHLSPRQIRDLENDALPYVPDADVAVIAGDIADAGDPVGVMRWLGAHLRPHVPVVAVLGNHEFYGELIGEARAAAAAAAEEEGIHLLDDATVTIAGVRFVGATLWTDYDLYSDCDHDLRRRYMYACRKGLPDHKQIGIEPGSMELFKPRHALEMHWKSRQFIEQELDQDHDGQTVVVTHHAPHPRSVAPEFAGDLLTPAFVSDLEYLFHTRPIDAWLHGHTHASFDYTIEDTRVVCNPRGFGLESEFDPEMVVDISRFGPKPPR